MQMLQRRWERANTLVCVGLDPVYDRIPECIRREYPEPAAAVEAFNEAEVDATKDLVCAFKPNSGFYEALGPDGVNALANTVAYINDVAPEVPVILDAKRGDIGNTNLGYIAYAFDVIGADAITVPPWLGRESLLPLLELADKGVIVLCVTSNKGSGEFQNLKVGGKPLYQIVAEHVARTWNTNGNCALVVGATRPQELAQIREIVGDMSLLIPGIGAQGGDVEKTLDAGLNSRGDGLIITVSRSAIYASPGEDFAQASQQYVLNLRDMINRYREVVRG